MAVYMKQKKDRWTPEEIALLRQGIVPEGRTPVTARAKAKSLGITLFDREGPRSRWTPEEIETLRNGIQPPGRSEVACFYKGLSLGLDVKFDGGTMSVAPKATAGDRRKKLLERARRYARLKEGGETLAEIGRRDGISRQRVCEIIGELSTSR